MHETTSLHVERFESSDLKAELSVEICYNLYSFVENRNII